MGAARKLLPARAPARSNAGALGVLAVATLLGGGGSSAQQRRLPVVVVLGDLVGDGAEASRRDAEAYKDNACSALRAAGVLFEETTDTQVAQHGLPSSAKVAIFPYNRAISGEEAARLHTFVAGGGRLIVCFLAPESILRLCGVESNGLQEAQSDGQFGLMRFAADTVARLPAQVNQNSWIVHVTRPLEGATVVANWCNLRGEDSGLPAVVVGETGAFLSHVLLPGDREAKGAVLRALVGHFAPEIWADVALAQLEAVKRAGTYETLAELITSLQERQDNGEYVERSLASAREAQSLVTAARDAYHAGDMLGASELATEALTATRRAYYATYPAKPGELRAAWMAYKGTPTWQDTMRALSNANFNAAFPRVASAGVAYYRSTVLPLSPRVAEEGDALAEACLWGRRYGIDVHARLLALFVYEADPAVLQAFGAQGRLMQTAAGQTDRWLCPTHPKNRALVVKAAAELATKYDVAGVQLDYIRYPGLAYCYCPRCKARFEADAGVTVKNWPFECTEGMYCGRWADWRREQITSIVREVAQRVRSLRPEAQISAAVFADWEPHRQTIGQDWKTWADEGVIDFVCPMDYTGDISLFEEWVRKQYGWVAGKVPLCIGIGPSVPKCELSPQDTLSQIHRSRQLGGDGFALFQFDGNLAADYLPVLAAGATAAPTAFSLGPPTLRCSAVASGAQTRLEALILPRCAQPGIDNAPPLPVIEEADLAVYTATGHRVLDLGPVRSEVATEHELRLPPGTYRLAALGWLSLPQGGQREFVRWGPVFGMPCNDQRQ